MKNIVQRIIQRNIFSTHTENILLAMPSDSDEATRKDAVDTIISFGLHYQIYPKNKVSKFRVPMINFKASKSWIYDNHGFVRTSANPTFE